jgi:spore maturation protein CgeB
MRTGVMWDFSEILNYDLIVLLHSTNADSILPLVLLESYFKSRKGKLLMFVGNEYCLMPEKIRFINDVEVDYVASQLPGDAARWLYSDCSNSNLLLVPHALNEKVYRPYQEKQSRPIEIGFIGDRYSYAIGDVERTELAEYFAQNSRGKKLTTDIRIGRKLRIPREEYVKFLNSTRGTIGAESGTYYLEKTDRTQKDVEAFLSRHPDATFEEVYEGFFKNYTNPINGKAISSRHFEPIGTKTCQILLEGNYNGILKPNTHYIPLNKDYSNVDEVLERFADRDYVRRMVGDTYEYVVDNHTHEHRVLNVWREVS